MKILQLTSDWKWTGPAEPMLRLGLAQREGGNEVFVACPEAPEEGSRSVAAEARALGIAPDLSITLGRGVGLLADRDDVAKIVAHCRTHEVDVIHAWHTRDHVMAIRAARRLGQRRPAVVRSYRSAERISTAPWSRWLFGRRTDGLLCVSPATALWNEGLRQGRPTRGAFGAVDVDRFRPDAPGAAAEARRATRKELGLPPDAEVIGIVARAQSHRRFDLLLAAAAQLFARRPNAVLLVVGRGTRREELAERPAQELGIGDRVVFAGYRNADYAAVLQAIDVFTFLVPGSDGTCRALLEAAACGIPAVTTRRGSLPEIVVDQSTGILVSETPEALAAAWAALLSDDARRTSMGVAARSRALSHFTSTRFAETVDGLYREALTALGRPAA